MITTDNNFALTDITLFLRLTVVLGIALAINFLIASMGQARLDCPNMIKLKDFNN